MTSHLCHLLVCKKKKICKDGRIEKDKTWRSDMKDSEEDSLSISTKIWFHSAQQMERGSSRRRHDRRHHHGEVGWRRRWLLYWISIFLFTVVAHNDKYNYKKTRWFLFFQTNTSSNLWRTDYDNKKRNTFHILSNAVGWHWQCCLVIREIKSKWLIQ